MARVDMGFINKMEEQAFRLDHVRANLKVVALGMRGDTLGSDVPAVEACEEMLEVIYNDMMSLLEGNCPENEIRE